MTKVFPTLNASAFGELIILIGLNGLAIRLYSSLCSYDFGDVDLFWLVLKFEHRAIILKSF